MLKDEVVLEMLYDEWWTMDNTMYQSRSGDPLTVDNDLVKYDVLIVGYLVPLQPSETSLLLPCWQNKARMKVSSQELIYVPLVIPLRSWQFLGMLA